MAYGLIDYNTLKNISNALREKTNSNVNYYPRDMARAIDAIVTGGAIDEPCMFSSGQYYDNYYDNNIINRYSAVGIEVSNTFPTDWDNPPEYFKIIDSYAEWAGFSPDSIVFYERSGSINNRNGNIYGMYVNNKWRNDQASIIDITDLFTYAGNITQPYCGNLTSKMVNSYYGCYNITDAVCGPLVSDMTNCYASCGNLRNAACGNSVKIMKNAYAGCYNLQTINIGPNVRDATNAFKYCSNATGEVNLGDYLISIENAFYECSNVSAFHGTLSNVEIGYYAFYNCQSALFDKLELDSLVNGEAMFQNCRNLTDIGNVGGFVSGAYMFDNCVNLVNIGNINFENAMNAYRMFSNVNFVSQELHDSILGTVNANANLVSMFYNCGGIDEAWISNRFNNLYKINALYMGSLINNLRIDPDVNNISYVMYGSGLVNAACTDSVTHMKYAFALCHELVDAVMGNNVTDASYAYWGCSNLVNAACGDSLTVMDSTYQDCANLERVAIGSNLTNIHQGYSGCVNLQGDIDLLNVNRMRYAFKNDANIQNIVIRSTDIELNRYHLEEAFYRTDYSLRRNIVLTNINSYTNFINYSMNTIGQAYMTEITNEESVNVNNVMYNTVRCAYNAAYNCYVYCTE